ncbi:MAG TPA: MBL fold metallo-hydrolase [Firmicutes bacterium]|nr:MBL fold metallo-hydrolase [Bacillota bacterium]
MTDSKTGADKLAVYPLGTAGWIPSNGMETCCFAFLWGTELIIIDAGTGIARLVELKRSIFKSSWKNISRVRIFLTHYHLDHCVGLFWMRGIFGELPIRIHAPGEWAYGKTAYDILNGLFKKPYSPYPMIELNPNITVEDMIPEGFQIGEDASPLHVRSKLNMNHSDPSIAFRFGDFFAFVSDTPPEEETIEFVRGVKVLLHESYYGSFESFGDENDSLEKHTDTRHTGSMGAGLISKRAGVLSLYLIHHNPERDMRDAENDAKRVSESLGLNCRAAKDLEEITIEM